ncbi:MAG: S1 RNA-binding domain-containing protein [Planctomyces sp.]|nr:S1 RNA-binding domain-containing protein [Planctomyces sp.]
MIEIGAVVEADVSRVEAYGIFLTHKSDSIFVPMNNVTWHADLAAPSDFQPGAKVKVLVERLNYKNNVYAGSIKHLSPEGNPYRDLSRQPPERIFSGRVKMVHHDGIVVDLGNGCVGDLPKCDQTTTLSEGSEVEVQITSLELDEQRVGLKLVHSKTASP